MGRSPDPRWPRICSRMLSIMATNKQDWLGPLAESFRLLWRWLSASAGALRPALVRFFVRLKTAFSGAAGRLRRSRADAVEANSERGPPNAEGSPTADVSRRDWLRSALRVDAW